MKYFHSNLLPISVHSLLNIKVLCLIYLKL
jgi:hypothetical protein